MSAAPGQTRQDCRYPQSHATARPIRIELESVAQDPGTPATSHGSTSAPRRNQSHKVALFAADPCMGGSKLVMHIYPHSWKIVGPIRAGGKPLTPRAAGSPLGCCRTRWINYRGRADHGQWCSDNPPAGVWPGWRGTTPAKPGGKGISMWLGLLCSHGRSCT